MACRSEWRTAEGCETGMTMKMDVLEIEDIEADEVAARDLHAETTCL